MKIRVVSVSGWLIARRPFKAFRHEDIISFKAKKCRRRRRGWIMETGRELKHKSINRKDLSQMPRHSFPSLSINLNLLTPNRSARDGKSTLTRKSQSATVFHIRAAPPANHCATLMNCALKLLFCRPPTDSSFSPFFYSLHKSVSLALFTPPTKRSKIVAIAINMLFFLSFSSLRAPRVVVVEMSYVTFSLEVTVGVILISTRLHFMNISLASIVVCPAVLFLFLHYSWVWIAKLAVEPTTTTTRRATAMFIISLTKS